MIPASPFHSRAKGLSPCVTRGKAGGVIAYAAGHSLHVAGGHSAKRPDPLVISTREASVRLCQVSRRALKASISFVKRLQFSPPSIRRGHP